MPDTLFEDRPRKVNKDGQCVLPPSSAHHMPEPCDEFGNPIHPKSRRDDLTIRRQNPIACPANHTLCPVVGGTGEGECVDTRQELENCEHQAKPLARIIA